MSTFVGRIAELKQMNNLLNEARQKRGSVVLLSGEAGIGKSALVDYFLANYATNVQFFCSKCNEQYGEGSSFLPWIEILSDIISDKDTDDKPIASKLLAVVKDTLGPWMGVVPVVGSLTAAVWETGKSVKTQFREKSKNVKDRYTRDDFYQSYVTMLHKVGELSPVVLFIDDLHWGDASSIGLLRWLTEKITNLPVLIIGAYRPSEINVGRSGISHSLKDAIYEMHARYHLWTVLDLNTFSQDLVNHYITIAFPENLFKTTFVVFLYDITDGNPFFLEQYIQLLEEQGHLIQLDEKWQLTCDLSVIQDEVPKDVQGLIQKRLDRLQDETMKNVLLYGSAEGEEFTSFVLSKLMGWESLATIEHLNLLTQIKQQLVEMHRLVLEIGTISLPKANKTTKYQFVHTVLHKVLYNGLSGEQRALLHQAIGECLEAEYQGHEIEIAEKLAYHFSQSGETEKAIYHLLWLSEVKNGDWGTPGVEVYCQQALDLSNPLEDTDELQVTKVNLLIEMARAKLAIGKKFNDDEASDLLQQASSLARTIQTFDISIKLDYWWGWLMICQENGEWAMRSFEDVFDKGQEKISAATQAFFSTLNYFELEPYPHLFGQLESYKQNIQALYEALDISVADVLKDINEMSSWVATKHGYQGVFMWWHQCSFDRWMYIVGGLISQLQGANGLISKSTGIILPGNWQVIDKAIKELSFLPYVKRLS